MKWNLTQRLKQALPPDEWVLLTAVADAAAQLGLPLYVVGGLPRDLILGKPSSDFDLVVEGRAELLAQKLSRLYGGALTVHSRFGTARWDLADSRFEIRDREWQRPSLDIVSARSETYKHPGALPTVTPGSIFDDLRRRDFSINALAIRLDGANFGELRDDLGGLEDLRAGVLRVLHDRSFEDDPTRMYRAVRYEARYGFRIAPETMVLMPPARPLVEGLSAHRIRHELDLVLDEARPAESLARLAELDLLRPIHPALYYDKGVHSRLLRSEAAPPRTVPAWPAHELRWVLWLLVLTTADIQSLNKRLHFQAPLLQALLAASSLRAQLPALAGSLPSKWVEALDPLPLIAVYAAGATSSSAQVRKSAEQYLAQWRHIKPSITGRDLKQRGVKPGPHYASILRELRRARLDGEAEGPEQEQLLLQELLDRRAARSSGK